MRAFDPKNIPQLDEDKYGFVKNISKPIILDIGCGTGHSSLFLASNNPNAVIIGIERTKEKFSKFLKNLENLELKNIITINEDAVAFVTQFINDQSVDEVYLLYPNPYPKAKQDNKRFHNMPFMSELIKKMKPGARLTQATNILNYHEEAINKFTKTWGLEIINNIPVTMDTNRTLFEKKYLERGDICYELQLKK